MKQTTQQRKALCLLNFSGRYGGAEKRFATLFRYLLDHSFDFRLIINDQLYQIFIDNGVLVPDPRIVVFHDRGIFHSSGKSGVVEQPKSRKSGRKRHVLRRYAGQIKYFMKTLFLWMRFSVFFLSVVHRFRITDLYGVWQGGVWTWMWCRLTCIRLTYSVNASGRLMLYRRLFRFFDSQYYVMKHAHRLDFLSPALVPAYRYALKGRLKGEVLVSPHSLVNTEIFTPKYPKLAKVVFLGRMEALKNPWLFLHAVSMLQKKPALAGVKYYMAGDGRLLPELKEYARNHLPQVVFTGVHDCPSDLLGDASVFVSLQVIENYPSQSLMEAMACACGVVVTDVGETRRLVTHREGLLVHASRDEVALAIEKLLTDPDLRKALGDKAREKILSNHTPEKFAQWFASLMMTG